MNTITLTDEQMKALQSGQSITIEPPKPPIAKWEPKGGKFLIYGTFNDISIDNCITIGETHSGLRYQTRAQAEQAAKALRSYARQLNWISENDDGWVADWNDYKQNKYFVSYNHCHQKITRCNSYNTQFINTIYMSEANASKLAQLMNDGIIEF